MIDLDLLAQSVSESGKMSLRSRNPLQRRTEHVWMICIIVVHLLHLAKPFTEDLLRFAVKMNTAELKSNVVL